MKQGKIRDIMKIFFIAEDADKIIAKKFCMINTEYQFMLPVEPVFILDPFRRIRCIQNYNDSTWKNIMEIISRRKEEKNFNAIGRRTGEARLRGGDHRRTYARSI